MSALYVTLSSQSKRNSEQRTGVPRAEYEIARGLVARGGQVLRYSKLLRRFRFADLGGDAAQDRRNDSSSLQEGGTIVVPGIFYRQGPIDELARKRRQYGMRVGIYLYDLMPIRRPEFMFSARGAAEFRRFVDGVTSCADFLCVSSEAVGSDLKEYLDESGKRDVPIHHIPLCADLKDRVEGDFTQRLRSLELKPESYALYVATLNPRKNHVLLYWYWRRLVEELGDATPTLVLAGQRGWNDRDLLDLMSRDREMWGRHVRFVEGPSDAELVELYRNCAFTLLPSSFEGWGLPITESLSFGKPCIAADNTSLREAGQGLATHIDHLDGPGWLAAIKQLALDPTYRRERSALIAERYRTKSWDDVGEEIFRIATAPG
jgi:glycosyltransferase involved in cell wall biosynthesis